MPHLFQQRLRNIFGKSNKLPCVAPYELQKYGDMGLKFTSRGDANSDAYSNVGERHQHKEHLVVGNDFQKAALN